ncbi:AN1-type zinc finger protein 3 isoform X1 [Symphalangus syndactylus]|uniref:AN1-type zinc finger protein 3 isoform X1 n=2 Tax=Symphalangus syndactylus TaxID=9590 RepID=UPI002441D31E|nr:AN1-type zinc finger protein 3 isoform X1 [Symphalangus syndactylus]
MGDAGSERSKAPSLPPRCPCGFWGSSKTMNLCSKCFADFQKKQPDDDSAPSTSNSQSDLFSEETTSDNNNTSITTPTLSPSQQPLPTELNVTSPSKEECGPCTDTAHVSLITPTKRSCGTDSQSENEASPVKRPRLLENTERSEETSRSKQKSRRRCFQCQTKLELVQQELGSCRCGLYSAVTFSGSLPGPRTSTCTPSQASSPSAHGLVSAPWKVLHSPVNFQASSSPIGPTSLQGASCSVAHPAACLLLLICQLRSDSRTKV